MPDSIQTIIDRVRSGTGTTAMEYTQYRVDVLVLCSFAEEAQAKLTKVLEERASWELDAKLRLDLAEADLARVTAERDTSKRREDEMRGKLLKESEGSCALRSRNAELEQSKRTVDFLCELHGCCPEMVLHWCEFEHRQRARVAELEQYRAGDAVALAQLRIRVEHAEAEAKSQTKQRIDVENMGAELLRKVDEIVNDANHSAEARLCAAANRLLNTRAEFATPDKQEVSP